MLPSAYIETSVISYLTGRQSRDAIAAAHQQLTRDWWEQRRARFEIYVSELVVQERAAEMKLLHGLVSRRSPAIRFFE
jgi:predicted nucleic acid-binding protein